MEKQSNECRDDQELSPQALQQSPKKRRKQQQTEEMSSVRLSENQVKASKECVL
jgi:hypothetical protein